jgi:hypothetical protein
VQLAEVDDYPSAMAVLVESLKRKGVRLDEHRFQDGDITHLNKYVTIIRGDAAELLHRAYESIERGGPTQQGSQDVGLPFDGAKR